MTEEKDSRKSLTEFIEYNMTTESADIFLKMKKDNLENYNPILISVWASVELNHSSDIDSCDFLNNALEGLALIAQKKGCTYVTSIKEMGTLSPTQFVNILDDWGSRAYCTTNPHFYILGTGLIRRICTD